MHVCVGGCVVSNRTFTVRMATMYIVHVYRVTCEMSEESLRQQKMVAKISTRSRGGWSTESWMFLMQNPIQPLVWT